MERATGQWWPPAYEQAERIPDDAVSVEVVDGRTFATLADGRVIYVVEPAKEQG